MKILFDTNVILDHVLARKPHLDNASTLINYVEAGVITGFLCATTITTIHYFAAKSFNQQKAKKLIKILLTLFDIAPVNRAILATALTTPFKDFEDAVLHESSLQQNLDGVVTRNIKDFKKAKLPVFTPIELTNILK